jgi:hypothetical protein
MTSREVYDELGRQLGLTAEAEFVDTVRRLAGAAIGQIVADLLKAKTVEHLDQVGLAIVSAGENIRAMVAKRVEGAVFARSMREDTARERGMGGEQCPVCGVVGQHLCRTIGDRPPDPPAEAYGVVDNEVIDVSGLKKVIDDANAPKHRASGLLRAKIIDDADAPDNREPIEIVDAPRPA